MKMKEIGASLGSTNSYVGSVPAPKSDSDLGFIYIGVQAKAKFFFDLSHSYCRFSINTQTGNNAIGRKRRRFRFRGSIDEPLL